MYHRKMFNALKKLFIGLMVVLVIGYLVPQHIIMPVDGATRKSYSQNSFWAYPWGKSVTHKGVDIFAKKGTNVYNATAGIVLFKGKTPRGGNVVYVLGPKWRIHYYAHLDEIKAKRFSIVTSKTIIGTVGNTGNAINKPAHLHYVIKTLIPYPWQADKGIQGKRKMFYVNPIEFLNKSFL